MRRLTVALLASMIVSCGAQLPTVLRDEAARAPRGTVTIVFFTDFQCPFCRRTHAALAPVVRERKDHVRVVLKHVPLRSHPDARSAARAAICAEQLGATGDYAHALFTSDDLGDAACERALVAQGVPRDKLRACVADPATDARIERDTETFDALDGDGVPLLFVTTARRAIRLDGQQSRRDLEAALDDAIASEK